ncbi:hypothetical protein OUZ56_033117 [Daphnia magna]|uniref:Uncharacterized protein n=1 Tax=Daphnia magna TaxID=35525 RepID=A0ABR0BA85_9CRUS|nr:hypothetical protein OUZ56_033117 [Daphnia magna]
MTTTCAIFEAGGGATSISDENVSEERASLGGGGEPVVLGGALGSLPVEDAHRGVPDDDVRHLLHAGEDVLLDVRDAVLRAESLHLRLKLLVAEHREIGPDVVLNLVIEVPLEEVDDIAGPLGRFRAGLVIDRPDDLADVALGAVLRARREAVHVVAGVIRPDDRKRVHVLDRLGDDRIEDRRRDRQRAERGEKCRNRDEIDRAVGEVALEPEVLPGDRRRRLARLLNQVLVGEHAERVRRVIGKLPGDGEAGEHQIALRLRHVALVDPLDISLDQIGIAFFAGRPVMEDVVLEVPRLRHHPIGPVEHAAPALGEDAARALRADAGDLVVALVADVMHRDPPARAPEGEGDWRNRGRNPGEAPADGARGAPPALHFGEVVEVFLAEFAVDFFSQRIELGEEPFKVHRAHREGLTVLRSGILLRMRELRPTLRRPFCGHPLQRVEGAEARTEGGGRKHAADLPDGT